MLNALVFDAKIVNNKGERNWAGDVPPEAERVGYFEVSILGKAFLEELVGKDARLRYLSRASLCGWKCRCSHFHFLLKVVGVLEFFGG